MDKTNIYSMTHKKIQITTADNVPGCHGSFFRASPSDQFIEIASCKSFSKSKQKKLKLITDRRSLEKKSEFLQLKRKIKPLKLKVATVKSEQRTKAVLCSIKGFKEKINKITQQSSLSSKPQMTTINTEMSQNVERQTQKTNNGSNESSRFYVQLSGKGMVGNQIIDPFPTLRNSLVVQESCFNPQSLLQSHQPSKETSFHNSPKNEKILHPQDNFTTPMRDKKQEQDWSTRATNKTQKITLSNARKVETFETLVTQNDGCMSVAERVDYQRFFENIAFPDYFSGKQYKRVDNDQQMKSNNKLTHPTQSLIHLY